MRLNLIASLLYCSSLLAQPAVERGEGLLKAGDLAGAARVLSGPAQGGNPKAQFLLGMVEANLGRDQGARAWWTKASNGGNGDAATALGYFALGGRGGEPRSSSNAARLFSQGARGGSGQGMLNLSRLLMIGDGIGMDRARAGQLRQQAAGAGEPTATALVRAGANKDGPAIIDVATWLGNFGRAREGVSILEAEAKQGDVAAMIVLGKIHYNGQAGAGRNYELARAWWERAGRNPAALYALGILYMYGRGVHTDWGRAEVYFSGAAKLGHPDGARMAATMRSPRVPTAGLDQRPGFSADCGNRGGYENAGICIRNGDVIDVK